MTMHRLAPRLLLVACLVLAQQYAAAHRLAHVIEGSQDAQRVASCECCVALAAVDAPATGGAIQTTMPHAAPVGPVAWFAAAAPSRGATRAHRCRAPPVAI